MRRSTTAPTWCWRGRPRRAPITCFPCAVPSAGCTVVTLQPTRTDLAVMGINPLHGGRIDEVVTTVAASVRDRLRARPEIAQLVSPGLRAAG